VDRETDSWISDDKGVNEIGGDYNFQFEIRMSGRSNDSAFYVLASDIVGTLETIQNADVLTFFDENWSVQQQRGGSIVQDSGPSPNVTLGVVYFITVARVGSVVTATIRTGSHGGSVFWTDNVDNGDHPSFRHFHAFTTRGDDAEFNPVTGFIQNALLTYNFATTTTSTTSTTTSTTSTTGSTTTSTTGSTTTTTSTVTTTTSTVTTTTPPGQLLETWGENTADDYNNRAEDSDMQSVAPDTNQSAAISLLAGNQSGGARRTVIRFTPKQDISDVSIVSAKLYLKSISTPIGGSSKVIDVHRLLKNWVLANVTWNDYTTSTAWNTGGAEANSDSVSDDGIHDHKTTPEDSKTITDGSWYNFDITSLVQEWVDGTSKEYGLLVQSTAEADGIYAWFISSNNSTDGQRPYLEITYIGVASSTTTTTTTTTT
jgi:hypothetical protein